MAVFLDGAKEISSLDFTLLSYSIVGQYFSDSELTMLALELTPYAGVGHGGRLLKFCLSRFGCG